MQLAAPGKVAGFLVCMVFLFLLFCAIVRTIQPYISLFVQQDVLSLRCISQDDAKNKQKRAVPSV